MRRGGLVLTVAALLLLPAAPASADVFDVTNTTELVSAINESNTNLQADTINVAAGTYDLTSALVVQGEDLTIDGDGAKTTIIRQTGPFRVIDIANSSDDVDLLDLTITGGNVNGNGGGVRNFAGSGDLRVERSAIEGNRATAPGGNDGGGGIHNFGGALTVVDSSVSNNSASISAGPGSGGGGIWSNAGATLQNSTVSGNTLTATSLLAGNGGGGYFTLAGGGTLTHMTFAGNPTSLPGGAVFNGGSSVTLENSILVGTAVGSGSTCSGVFTSGDNNLESTDTCDLDQPDDKTSADPRLGALEDNGGQTKTRAFLRADSPAINGADFTVCQTLPQDQRGVDRPIGGECDIGAFEFDGRAVATIPDCSPTGQIPLTMTAAPGEGVDSFHYKVDGGAEQVIGAQGTEASTVLDIPEGRRQLEYWGQFTNGPELNHHTPGVLVDKTDPSVSIQSEQKRSIYVITRRATIGVAANDALSGLVGDPSAEDERITTASRGSKVVTKTATDLCGNQTSAALPYRVLGPGLGVRAVLEPLGGNVKVKLPGSASAAQKGGGFVTLSQPREIPVGSLLDTRDGTVRLTSSRSRRATAIQDGRFVGGLFQVLQSRKTRAKGLTSLGLKGASFARCRAGSRGARAAQSRRALRRLRANARGRFRTRGRFSAATVRGTIWTVTDRCDGTLTRVARGRVAVRDFRRHRTVVLRRGKSYLAPAPGGAQP